VVIRVPGPLLELTRGVDHVEVDARTVREAFLRAGERYPDLPARIITPEGEIWSYVNVYVNEEDIRGLQGLETPLNPGDEIIILLAMSGG
jgi:molybdopterin converting factor small subunit